MSPANNGKRKGSRIVGAIIILLVVLFFIIEFTIRQSRGFASGSLPGVLLSTLQVIVLLLFLILFFVLGRNMVRLYMERRQRVLGARFKTKLVLFFISLSLIPTLLLFFFASDLISRNIETWFRTPLDGVLEDTKTVGDSLYRNAEELTLHYAQRLSQDMKARRLVNPENRPLLREFIRNKLKEYRLDEIGVFLGEEELFSYLNPDLPLQDYRDVRPELVKRAYLGEALQSVDRMGNGQMIRRGVAFNLPDIGDALVSAGTFLPQNTAEKIDNISAFVLRYRQLKLQRNPVKTFYVITLLFITLIIVFAASWLGFRLAKGITVPIEKLAQATREVSRGNLEVRVEDPASDELGILVESFNQMISDLSSSQISVAQKTAELETRKQSIETILNHITTGVIALDAEGRLTSINPSARDMLSLAEKDVLGRSYGDVLAAPRFEGIRVSIDWEMKNRHKLSDREIILEDGGQQRTLALTLTPLLQPDGESAGTIVVLDDLTQLIKAQKIAAWKEVAQRVAHEIKNPLTPIQLSAERIIKNMSRGEPSSGGVIEEGARVIIQEAKTIKALVDEFSDFARLPRVKLQPGDLHQVLHQVLPLFRGIFSEVEFELRLGHDIPPLIPLDPEQMKRVFINLLDNAIEAMNKAGRISIATSFDPAAGRVRIEVADSGPGISRDIRDKIFLPYTSTKKKGRGLGLAIVDQVIREHDGVIDVQSNHPTGAKFIIEIPT
ncbi:MAG: PAS domain-containing sensor histidine kinase [Candidatus Aminicenantes bacterium RBG_13_63_10]|nr:MAG: PAS domain-containing sensor histidine kinase [Candidatus Aminicenantes bacterium RBG_13_63_10]